QVVDDKISAVHGSGAIVRLAGANRYMTNLLVLNEAGVEGQDMLVASGTGFADALSASAAKRPILLVGGALTTEQKSYLDVNSGSLTGEYYIIGGPGAVSQNVETQVAKYGKTIRLAGGNRYATSIAVAEQFFPESVDTVVIANGKNFPDGLSGGPIAAAYDAPLILVIDSNYGHAASFFAKRNAFHLSIMGGTGVIAEQTAIKIVAGTE
ncbi:MAG: cell wall-binding repeat-containing protein, partial [Clostridia bacterium]|nr:cell wall-binding repeat-containing protein [Clostridia bacterium]